MIKALEELFNRLSTSNKVETLSDQDLSLATAALLVEVAAIDQNVDDSEWQQLTLLLSNNFQLSLEEAESLAQTGRQASENSASLYDFTQLINRHCDYSQKITLLKGLWTVAYADSNLSKYEEHIIRRIADLIHVSHSDFIQAKIQVRDS